MSVVKPCLGLWLQLQSATLFAALLALAVASALPQDLSPYTLGITSDDECGAGAEADCALMALQHASARHQGALAGGRTSGEAPVDVFYCIEGAANVEGLFVSLTSAQQASSDASLLRFHVFATNASDADVERLCNVSDAILGQDRSCLRTLPSGASLSIERVPAAVEQFAESLKPAAVWPKEDFARLITLGNFVRFAVHKLLPDTSDVAIYADTDTLVLGDVLELARLARGPMASATLLMADRNPYEQQTLEMGVHNESYARQNLSPVLLERQDYNAGLMVFNLAHWRKNQAFRRLHEWIKLNDQVGLFKGGNQKELNAAFSGEHESELGVVDSAWNCANLGNPKELVFLSLLHKCKVIHFAGRAKPWEQKFSTQPGALPWFAEARSSWRDMRSAAAEIFRLS